MISIGEKRAVPAEFDRVARSYDLLSAWNPGYSRHLEMSAERMGLPPGARILDLCCGTGLSTAALRSRYPDATITALDASEGMLRKAREKSELGDVEWLLGDAMDPSAAGATGPYDAIFMAYGLRNVPDPDACLDRLRALIVPGGLLCLHEYSVRGSAYARIMWNLVTIGIVIPLGVAFSGTTKIFRYLRRSVLAFDSVEELNARLARAGLEPAPTATMDGWQRGIVHTFIARRPD